MSGSHLPLGSLKLKIATKKREKLENYHIVLRGGGGHKNRHQICIKPVPLIKQGMRCRTSDVNAACIKCGWLNALHQNLSS